MAFSRQDDLDDDVSALMGAADEVVWQRAGLFATADSLGVSSKTLISPSGDLTYNLTTPNNKNLAIRPQ
jgi:hypothetical protein